MGLLSFFFDTKFKKDIHKYDKESYVKDLKSYDKDKKIRAIWGIEANRSQDKVKDLRGIAHNKNEDKWVKREAGISIRNLKKQR